MMDPRSIAALDAAHKFGRGEIGEELLKAAADAAYAADDYDNNPAADAVYEAARADAFAYARYIDVSTDATTAYACSCSDACDDAYADENLRVTADICRSMLTEAVRPHLTEEGMGLVIFDLMCSYLTKRAFGVNLDENGNLYI